MADTAKTQSSSLMWLWILLAIGGIGALGYFVIYPMFKKDDKEETPETKPTGGGGGGSKPKPTGGGGSGNNGGGGGNTGPTQLNVQNANFDGSLKSLSSSFSVEGLVAQSILRYKGFKGKNGKSLTLDGKAGGNTQFAIAAFWGAEKIDYDDQDLRALLNASKVDLPTILANQKENIKSGTGGKYTF